jgi:hypothetical protein
MELKVGYDIYFPPIYIFYLNLLKRRYLNLPGAIMPCAGKGTLGGGEGRREDQLLLKSRLNRAGPAANEIAAER